MATGLLAATGQMPLRAMQWLKVAGGAPAMAAALNYDPGVCIDPSASDQAQLGKLLFGNPALLGGQAAKARLTCASCHVDGADNPFFHFPGASGAAGTADVSNSFFSAAGANDVFDPVVIPNLAVPGKISQENAGELEAFLRTLIVKEFAGGEPSDETIAALAAYIRALVPCSQAGSTRQSGGVEADMAVVFRAAFRAQQAASMAPGQRDYDHERLYIAAARDRLGLIHERYDLPATASHGKAVEKASIALGAILNLSDPARRADAYRRWQLRLQTLSPKLNKAEPRSYYNQTLLQAGLR